MTLCPHCGSSRVASRRQLFLSMMGGDQLPGFTWYGESVPGALPPKSLFVRLGVVALGGLLSLVALFYGGMLSPQILVGAAFTIAAAVLSCLLLDVLLTYRRYRDWAAEWLCADCCLQFARSGELLPAN